MVEDRKTFADRIHSPMVIGVVLALAAVFAVAAWNGSRQALRERSELRFSFEAEQIQSSVRDRMIVYEQVLWGGVGLFNASDEVSRDEWAEYVASLDIPRHWPGIQGIGFSVPIEPFELESHIAEIRAEGFPEYDVYPTDPRDEYTAIIYLEPFDERNQRAFGYDMWSNEQRRDAMRAARDTGEAFTSGAITLVQETDFDVQRGFLTYVPVYDSRTEPSTLSERRASLRGWVYAAFRVGDLMKGILETEQDGLSYEIFDGLELNEETLLYDSDDHFSGHNAVQAQEFQVTTVVPLQGRQWLISIQANGDFVGVQAARQPTYIAIAGLIVNVLLLAVFVSQRRAKSMAEVTSELRVAKQDLEAQAREMQARTDQLLRSNDELKQFAYAASHDLQEPLRNLGNYASLMSAEYKGMLSPEADRWLGYISSSAQHMSNLLRALLVYGSLDGDATEFEPVDLDAVLRSVLEDLSPAMADSDVTVICDSLPTVKGNSFQIERLFLNVVGNAIKYRSERRKTTVWITVADAGERWRISVRDNGIGIKPEYHDLVFELFRRVGPRSKYEGTGIGLAVCQKIVAAHGGLIGVNSIPNNGSEFWFTLPKVRPVRDIDLRPRELARQ